MDSSPGSSSGNSTVNNPQLLPPRKRHDFITPDDGIAVQSTANPSHQSPPTPKDDNRADAGQSSSTKQENDQPDSASKTIFTWKKLYEIDILKGVLEYYKENGAYPFDNSSEMRKFYLSWIEKQGVHVDEDAFYDKLVDLPERFFLNRQIVRFTTLAKESVEDLMDPLEVQIYQLSYKIWGPTRDHSVNEDDGKDLARKAKQGGSSSVE